MVAEIGRYNCFKNSGHPPSWIFDIQFLTVCTVKRPITHHRETPILGEWIGFSSLTYKILSKLLHRFQPNLAEFYKSADTSEYFQLGESNEQLSITDYNASDTSTFACCLPARRAKSQTMIGYSQEEISSFFPIRWKWSTDFFSDWYEFI